MSERRPAARVWAYASLVLPVMAYGIVLFWFSRFTHARGLITPEGSVDFVYGAVGFAVLALRGIMLFVVPGVVAYRVAWRAMTAAIDARRSS